MRRLLLLFIILTAGAGVYAQALTGDYYIPKGTNARGFATLAEACSTFNANGVSGTVRFLIDGNLTETGANIYLKRADLTPTNNLVIKPAAGKTPVITFNGCSTTAGATQYSGMGVDSTSYITIDGSNTVNGTTRDMTFAMEDSVNGRIGITFYSNTDVIKVKNLKIAFNKINPINASTRGIYVNGQASGVADDFVVENCYIGDGTNDPYYAISVTGSSTGPLFCSKVSLRNNIVFGKLRRLYLFLVGTPEATCDITGNIINSPLPPITGNVVWGILINGYNGRIDLASNKLHTIRDTTNTTSGIYGFGTLDSRANGVVWIYNNFIGGDFTHTGVGIPTGIDLVSLQDTSRNVKIFNNSFFLNNMQKTASTRMTAIRMGIGTVEARNNIFYTEKDDSIVTLMRVDGGTLTASHNDYFANNAPNAALGYINGARYRSVPDWRLASATDSFSISINPGFVSSTDFHLSSNFSPVIGKGLKLADVPRDIDNELRDTPCEIGADEKPGITPVQLMSFSASVQGTEVTLSWQTSNERNNKGFDIERSTAAGTFEKIGFVASGAAAGKYTFTDKNPGSGTVQYRLKQLDYDGTANYSPVVTADITAPLAFALQQNYPNPFNPSTVIRFSLSEKAQTVLNIYSVTGELVKTILSSELEAGNHTVSFNAAGLSGGVYVAVLHSGAHTATMKMTLLK